MLTFFKTLFIFALSAMPILGAGQQCNLNIRGKIVDASTGVALSDAHIELKPTRITGASDANGNFLLGNLCKGEYHVSISHLGCAPEIVFINLKKDTVITIFLFHHSELISEVDVHAHRDATNAQTTNSISVAEIVSNANKNIAQQIENIAGVSSLNTGSGISKPIIHGRGSSK
jgi:iron complex outermembrane receptor protein